jgi:hypothetical protein
MRVRIHPCAEVFHFASAPQEGVKQDIARQIGLADDVATMVRALPDEARQEIESWSLRSLG